MNPSPADLARDPAFAHLENAGLVRAACAPWCQHNHALFPRAARHRAAALLDVGARLSLRTRQAGALWDCWTERVMEFAVGRDDECEGEEVAELATMAF